MAQSFFNESFIKGKDNVLNHVRHKKIRDKHLLTTDHGAWVALNDLEFKKLIKNELDDELFKLLENKGIIITENNGKFIMSSYRKRYDFLFGGVGLHIVVPTMRCNQKCIYCHSAAKSVSDKKVDMNEETAKKILEFIFQCPSKKFTIEFQGGEPLLNPEMFKYIVLEGKRMNKIHNKEINFVIVTNATLLNDDLVNFVMKEEVGLCTSLDGTEEIHDKNRTFEDGLPTYQKVIKGIKKFKEGYNYNCGVLQVTTRQSLNKWKELIDEYVGLGLKNIQIKFIDKLGFSKENWDTCGYTIQEFLEFWKKSVDYMIELNKNGIKIKDRYTTLIMQKINTLYDPGFLDFRSPCGIVMGQLAYDHNGDIYSCDEGRGHELFKLGNVKENTYKEILTSEKAQQLIGLSINDNYLCDNCAYKPYCGTCPVLNYAETGNLIPKLPSNNKCIMFKTQFDYIFEKLLFNKEDRKILFDWLIDWKTPLQKKDDNPNHFYNIGFKN